MRCARGKKTVMGRKEREEEEKKREEEGEVYPDDRSTTSRTTAIARAVNTPQDPTIFTKSILNYTQFCVSYL